MSIRGRDFRCEIEAELYEQLRMIADHSGKTIQMLGAELLEKMIVGEFHAFRIMVDRLEHSGMLRNCAESCGKPRNPA